MCYMPAGALRHDGLVVFCSVFWSCCPERLRCRYEKIVILETENYRSDAVHFEIFFKMCKLYACVLMSQLIKHFEKFNLTQLYT